MDQFKVERLKSISPVSVNLELRTLKAAFYTAVRWRYMVDNPFKKVALFRTDEEQPTYLNREEFQKLLSLVPDRWFRELVIVAVSTGLRRAELLNLRWSDVDFERGLLHVQSNENFRTKWGKRRTIPLSEVIFHLLRRRVKESRNEYVFTLNEVRVLEGLITHKFKRYVRKAGLNEELHFHSLRHTFATWLCRRVFPFMRCRSSLGIQTSR